MRIEPNPVARRAAAPSVSAGAFFDIGAATDTGRRPNNEDHHLIADLDGGLTVRRTSLGGGALTPGNGGSYRRLLLLVADGATWIRYGSR